MTTNRQSSTRETTTFTTTIEQWDTSYDEDAIRHDMRWGHDDGGIVPIPQNGSLFSFINILLS